jgi:DNA-binding NarL/FixJ family response regulator
MNIIVIDDHPMTIEGFSSVLTQHFSSHPDLMIEKGLDLEMAYRIISNKKTLNISFDLAIIDYTLPPYIDQNLTNGADLAIFIKDKMPECKILIVTAHTEVLLIYDIYKRALPNGFIIKNDVTPLTLKIAIDAVLDEKEFFSPMVLECMSEIMKSNLMKDDINRQLIMYLSKGYKAKDLEAVLFISKSAIEKRIYKLKKVFLAIDDSGLIKEVYRLGYI